MANQQIITIFRNCWGSRGTEDKYRGTEFHQVFKAKMFRQSEKIIENVDTVLVLNFNKNGQKIMLVGQSFQKFMMHLERQENIFH